MYKWRNDGAFHKEVIMRNRGANAYISPSICLLSSPTLGKRWSEMPPLHHVGHFLTSTSSKGSKRETLAQIYAQMLIIHIIIPSVTPLSLFNYWPHSWFRSSIWTPDRRDLCSCHTGKAAFQLNHLPVESQDQHFPSSINILHPK